VVHIQESFSFTLKKEAIVYNYGGWKKKFTALGLPIATK